MRVVFGLLGILLQGLHLMHAVPYEVEQSSHVHTDGHDHDHVHGPHDDHFHGPHEDHFHGPHDNHYHGPHDHYDYPHTAADHHDPKQEPEGGSDDLKVEARAEVNLVPVSKLSSGLVGGSLDLFQTQYGVSIIGTLKGLPTGQHGLAVHEGTSCQEPGLVYKAGRRDSVTGETLTELPPLRSLGNLGDVMTDSSGSGATTLNLLDTLLRLDGPFSISGRTLVIYSGQEDSTGSTGRAVACGVIKQVPLE